MFDGDDRQRGRSGDAIPGGIGTIPAVPRIVAVQGAGSSAIQGILASVARRWTAAGVRVAGVVEDLRPGLRKAVGGSTMRNLRSDARYDLYQDLGPLSTACCLYPAGVAEACQDVIREMADCDVVVLSKFGKLESERGGLLDAFVAAALSGRPVLTSVSPAYSASYLAFVGEFGTIVPPDEARLVAWGSISAIN